MGYELGTIKVKAEIEEEDSGTVESFQDVVARYDDLGDEQKEYFYALFLTNGNEVIGDKLIGLGGRDSVQFDIPGPGTDRRTRQRRSRHPHTQPSLRKSRSHPAGHRSHPGNQGSTQPARHPTPRPRHHHPKRQLQHESRNRHPILKTPPPHSLSIFPHSDPCHSLIKIKNPTTTQGWRLTRYSKNTD